MKTIFTQFHLAAAFLGFILFLTASCTDGLELDLQESRIIQIRPAVSEMTKATETAFEVNDTVGVRIILTSGTKYADNEKFVFDGQCLKSASGLEWYEESSTCDIVACYPYDKSYNGSASYSYNAAVDQSRYEDYIASDFLVGTASGVSSGSSSVSMVFNHRCTQFQLNLTNKSSEEILSVTFPELEYHQSLSFNFNGCSGDGYPPVDITPYHQGKVDGADVYKAFVPATQTAVFQVKVITSAKTRLFKVQNAFCFKAGTIYVSNITIEDTPSSSDNVSISTDFGDWTSSSLNLYDEDGNAGGGDGSGDKFSSFDEMYSAAIGKTYTASTPMGNHYIDKHVTTESDKVWLANPLNEPSTLPSAPSYTLKKYDVTLYPFGTPMPADVNQHGIGDCSACAVLAEMAYVAPEFIKSIIHDNGDETFTVSMYDPQGNPISVCVSSNFLGSSSIGAVSGKNNVACWSTVLEKAIMKWEKIYQVNPDVYGIGSEHVLPLFTGEGKSCAFSPGTLSASKLQSAVNLSFEEKCLIIGGFTKSGSLVGTSQTVSAHAYSFIKASSSSELFMMRNPWGYSPGDGSTYTDGLLHIKNDGTIPPLIDIRIIFPGALASYFETDLGTYTPPSFREASEFQRFLQRERASMMGYGEHQEWRSK